MTHRSVPFLATLIGVILGLPAPAHAEECACEDAWRAYGTLGAGDVYDPASGADLRNYAPDRHVDLEHMKLELTIADMNTPTLSAVEELTFSPIGAPTDVLSLDAVDFTLGEITASGGAEIDSVSYDGQQLQIRFAEPIPPGRRTSVRIEYTLDDPVDGLFWTPESEAWPDRAAQIHTQGQPETNRFWFASHDSPNERLTTEILVTVPDGFLVSANGKLVSQDSTDGVTTFHWLQDKDHVSYLVSLVVGKFDVVDVGTDELSMPVYVPPGRAGDVERTYGRTADMVRVFEERFDEPYPWDRYAQLVVHNFGAGGMENTSATTMYDTAIYSERGMIDDDLDGLISHELGHQWFGDLITCNHWKDIWLNEGFATYTTSLWLEARDGYDAGYLHRTLSNFDRFRTNDRLDESDPRAGLRPAMASRVYSHPWEVFRRKANPYPKGANVLHMLRMKLGDDVFFVGLARYVDEFKGRTVETPDFRRVMEDVSGVSLDRFFQQWVHRPGVPELDFTATYDLASRELHLSVEQTQRIDEFVPAFSFDMPVQITTPDGLMREIIFRVDSRRHEQTIPLAEQPTMVVVDPELHVMTSLTLDMPPAWLATQLLEGPTIPSRIRAARAITNPGDAARRALRSALFDPSNHHAIRSAAARAFVDAGDVATPLTIAGDPEEAPRARAGAIGAIASSDTENEQTLNALRKLCIDGTIPYGVRAAALRALGKLGAPSDIAILRTGLTSESRDDDVRQAALRALADLDTPEALDLVLPYVNEGWISRTRPVAIESVATLAHHNPERSYDAIEPLMTDKREARTRRAAIEALVKIKDERAIARLRHLARTHEHPIDRERCEDAAARLAAALDDNGDEMRERIERLEQRIGELEAKGD